MMKSGWLPCITVAAIRAGCANAGANLVNNFDANACRRFSAIPAPRARAVGQHGENLRRIARQIHCVGGETKSHGLAIGRAETSHGVPATRTCAESDAGGASVLASRTWRRKAKRGLVKSLRSE